MPPARTFIGKPVIVEVDRPLGSRHPEFPDLVYPLNYGFVPGSSAADGEEVDAYILGVDVPLKRFAGCCVAVIQRLDDVEDKLVVVPPGMIVTADQIRAATEFQERYFEIKIITDSRSISPLSDPCREI